MPSDHRIEELEKRVLALQASVENMKTVRFSNEKPNSVTFTRSSTGKLGYEVKVYADNPEIALNAARTLRKQADMDCGIAPDEATLSAPLGSSTTRPYNAGTGRE